MSDGTPIQAGAVASARPPLVGEGPVGERRDRLAALALGARACTRCPQLVSGRTQVVFGAGNPDADVMFVGEAPGVREDSEGAPFLGAPGHLLDELLAVVGLGRADVYLSNVLKCRPPGNRDPAPAEIARCRPYLEEQIALVQPRVVCAFGNFVTRLLREDPAGVKERHGRVELCTIGERTVHLLPLYHPAAALYTRALRDTLERDLAVLPELLARPAPPQPAPRPSTPPAAESAEAEAGRASPAPAGRPTDAAAAAVPGEADEGPARRPSPPDEQLGLF